jgi:hypothetical protein
MLLACGFRQSAAKPEIPSIITRGVVETVRQGSLLTVVNSRQGHASSTGGMFTLAAVGEVSIGRGSTSG